MTAAATIRAYYDAFNAGDMDRFLSLLTDDVAHDINQGARQTGKEAFAKFMDHMNRCYKEELTDMVIMVNEDGTRGAAEFIVNGTYLATDEGLPEANGQTYRLPAGSFPVPASCRYDRSVDRPVTLDGIGILREMHVLIDVVDPVERDVVVLAVSGIVLGQLDAACAIHVVDGADMGAVLGQNFHVFADLICKIGRAHV